MRELPSFSSRLLPCEYIASISGMLFEDYVRSYLEKRYEQTPVRPYVEKSEFDKFIDIWPKDVKTHLNRLKETHEQLTQHPLPLALFKDTNPEEKVLTFVNFVQIMASTDYPLISNEKIVSKEIFYLSKDYQQFRAGTLVNLRKTNFSHIYFVIPDIIFDVKNNVILPSKIYPEFDSVETNPTHLSHVAINPRLREEAFRPGGNTNTSASGIVNLVTSIIGSLSWATRLGPFVSAGITFCQALFGPADNRPDVSDTVISVGKVVISRLKHIFEQAEITRKTNVIEDFTSWLITAKQRLDNQDVQAIRIALIEPQGILEQLNKHLGTGSDTLHGIITSLLTDQDLSPNKLDAYEKKDDWDLAAAKLECLCLAISLYLFAIKTKIEIVGNFFALGYNPLGEKIPDNDPISHDSTTQFYLSEVKRFCDPQLVPAIIANVAERRLKMIQKPIRLPCVAEQSVGSRAKTSLKEAEAWVDKRISGDGIFIQNIVYQNKCYFYRLREKSQRDKNPNDPDFSKHPMSPDYMNWQLVGFYDNGKENATELVDFNLDDGLINYGASSPIKFRSNERVVDYKWREYVRKVAANENLFQWNSLPSQWASALEEWKQKITPVLPNDIDGIIITNNWQEKNTKDNVWSNKSLEVRYLYRFVNFFEQSILTNDHTSTPWTYADNRSQPEIIGFPIDHPALTYVTAIHIYRQLRLSDKIITQPERIGINERDVKTGNFSEQYIDKTPITKNELKQLKLPINQPTPIAHSNIFINTPKETKLNNQNTHTMDNNH